MQRSTRRRCRARAAAVARRQVSKRTGFHRVYQATAGISARSPAALDHSHTAGSHAWKSRCARWMSIQVDRAVGGRIHAVHHHPEADLEGAAPGAVAVPRGGAHRDCIGRHAAHCGGGTRTGGTGSSLDPAARPRDRRINHLALSFAHSRVERGRIPNPRTTAMPSSRRHDIDALRALAFALLILYHWACSTWAARTGTGTSSGLYRPRHAVADAGGEPLADGPDLPDLRAVGAFPAPRHARSAASSRMRSWRLLLPLVFGMLVVVPIQPYVEGVANGAGAAGVLRLPRALLQRPRLAAKTPSTAGNTASPGTTCGTWRTCGSTRWCSRCCCRCCAACRTRSRSCAASGC